MLQPTALNADVWLKRWSTKSFVTQPQSDNCTQIIRVPFIEYQTLSVNTKELRLVSQIRATLRWDDPDLSWDTSVYQFDEVILPVAKVWTPEIHVTNGILTTMKHSSNDLLVYSNGTVLHAVVITAEVNCEVNLFNYPFAGDECPVAIQTWATDGCGTSLDFFDVKMVDGGHGDWETNYVSLEKQRDDRNYIKVGLRIKYTNPFITLMLPSILIVLADVVSFALPLGGGERNCFKVTLVLSFTMFLIILNDVLPGDSECSPVIRTHFCICLILLVLSMLVSMILTGMAKNGSLIFCCWPKRSSTPVNSDTNDEKVDDETKADISVVQLNASEGDSRMLRRVVAFLDDLSSKSEECDKCQRIAETLDKIFFWCYLILGTAYFVSMSCIMVFHDCEVNHFDFWY
ncbi:-hydroxytryptamine receptor 3A-like [Xyrichtys novacula]|uniref:-hydroxytryptamine receptor 3A-like n=1 Tax=Xyrichtys novacula TaxID=13765 RepID=A0AAV1GNL3_XYRNO|nr:-hydroxytryptamine receptor 3A-like [Xyrichtys novacula]